MRRPKPTIGWREWISLPDLGVQRIKAKVDTGARSSSLHASSIEVVERDGEQIVRFSINAGQPAAVGEAPVTLCCEAPLHDQRQIRSSDGRQELRPVIRTRIEALGESWEIDLTLTSRDLMGFPMLLGREATRRRFVVDPGRSFLLRRLEAQRLKQED
ncbi:MAG TPA: RimK/LysX family protein [Polyangiaceae bacterium]|jgi:hypothetical protein|nr:RimK/LysX family protein [Polyangiaceae bacterium]